MSIDETKTLSSLCNRDREDPRFHALVEMMVAYMIHDKIAPDELRDAAYIASIKFMQMHPVRNLMYTNDLNLPRG